jgi:hypothetical protein
MSMMRSSGVPGAKISCDAVGRHVGGLGLVDRQPQPRVGTEVTATGARRHRDLTDDAGPNFSALLVLATLAVLDIGPFAVSCHGILS